MSTIAIIGAGGKMGGRIIDNLARTNHRLLAVEVDPRSAARLDARGFPTVAPQEAVAAADAIILAVPDSAIGVVARDLVPAARSGAMVVVLDAAAPYAGLLPSRSDVTYVVTHPCHPAVFSDETDPEARRDYFGGVAAKQNVVCALQQGPESAYETAAGLVAEMFAPVIKVFRVTVEQLVLLEPALSETTAATCITIVREAMDEVVRRGVPLEAARAFILGHLHIELAILFDEVNSPFSDGAIKAIERAKSQLFRDDWKSVLDWERIDESVSEIVGVQVTRAGRAG